MAVGTSLPSAPLVPGADDGQVVAYDRYIETQLLRTRRHVKSVDLAGAVMRLVVGSLVYLLLAALVDQWLVPGGLGFMGRLVTLLLFLTGLVSFATLWLGPLVLRRINPVFAAHTIESSQPGMKNSLINFLLLRSSPEGLAQRMYQAMEEQAVSGLTTVSIESAVDRAPLIRLLYALLAIVALAAVYQVASPKSPMASIRRVLAPWADIAPPTRVVIDEILPGNAEKYHDQLLTVSALVKGLKAGEPVTLHYWTGDGQVVDGRVGMSLPESGYRYQAELPPGGTGLQQDMEYTITAGDAVSQRYRIEVRTAPSVVVTELTYDYPPYTKLPQRVVERQGDIQALEGTQVTVRAAASHDIKSVHLDFDCNGSRDQEMKIDGRQASAAFPLLLKAKSDQPEHASYQLRFINTNGDENPKPVRYTIEVQRDVPPEIAVVEPRPDGDEELTLRLGSPLKLAFEAFDPDFELSVVTVHARRGKVTLFNHSMLAEPRAGRYDAEYLFNSGAHKLKVGDEVEFWVSADDNRQPQANHTETARIKVRIVPPEGEQAANDRERPADGPPPPQDQNQRNENSRPQENQRGKGDRRPKGPNEEEASADESPDAENDNAQSKRDGDKRRNRGVRQPEQSDNGNGEPRERKAGEASQEPPSEPGNGQNPDQKQDATKQGDNQRVDPENDPGRAVEEINKHFKDSPSEPKPPEGKNEQKQKPDDPRGNPSEASSNDRPSGSNSSKPEPGKEPNKPSPGDKRSPNQPDPKQDRSGNAGDEHEPNEGDSPMPGETPPGDERNQDRNAEPEKEKGEPAQAKPSAAQKNEPAQADKKKPKSKPKPDEKRGQGNQAAGDQGNTNDGDGKDPQGGEKATPGTEKPKPGKKSSPGQAGEKKEGDQSPGAAPENGAQYDDEAPETKDATADKPENAKPTGKGKPPKGETPPGETGAAGEQGADEESDGSQAQSEHASPGGNKSPGGKQEKKKEKGNDALVGDQEAQPGDEEGNDPKGKQAGQVRGHNDETEKPKENTEKNEGKEGGSTSDPKESGGAGEAGGNPKGSPDNQGPNAPREKKLDSSGAVRPNEPDKAESPSQSKRESDSKGGTDGDLSGGGDGGGGQKANTKGSGAPGKNEAADEGGGLSNERGAGGAGNDAGNKEKGDKPQGGQGAQEKGPGAKTRPGGEKAGGAASKQSTPNGPQDNADPKEGDGESPKPATDRDPDGQPKPDRNQRDQRQRADGSGRDQPPDQQGKPDPDGQPDAKGGLNPGQNQGGRGAPTGGGGVPAPDNEASEPPAPAAGPEPGGDDPNLDFARKATDLAIERLKDQLARDKPDPDLLEKLKWSREDMEQFVRRWEELKRSAKEAGERGKNGREELDAALRNLGLHARGSMVKGGKTRDDQNRGLSESRRIPPPAEYADQYREFSKGTAKGRPAKEK